LSEFYISKQFVHDVQTSTLNSTVSSFITENIPSINKYYTNLINSLAVSRKKNDKYLILVLSKLDRTVILDNLIHWLLLVLTYINTDIRRDEYVYLLSSTIRIGKRVVRSYLRSLFKDQVNKENFSYSIWIENWKKEEKRYCWEVYSDKFETYLYNYIRSNRIFSYLFLLFL
jgi:hypothetical protein